MSGNYNDGAGDYCEGGKIGAGNGVDVGSA